MEAGVAGNMVIAVKPVAKAPDKEQGLVATRPQKMAARIVKEKIQDHRGATSALADRMVAGVLGEDGVVAARLVVLVPGKDQGLVTTPLQNMVVPSVLVKQRKQPAVPRCPLVQPGVHGANGVLAVKHAVQDLKKEHGFVTVYVVQDMLQKHLTAIFPDFALGLSRSIPIISVGVRNSVSSPFNLETTFGILQKHRTAKIIKSDLW